MPHLRSRFLEKPIKNSIGWSPIVSLVGGRQTGKTTLLKRLSKESLSFDDPRLEERFSKSGEFILDTAKKPFFLDEVQKYPPAFDLLKLIIDRDRRPAQFLISGSIRFSSKKNIRESLTGRSVTWELLPLTLSETLEKPFPDWIDPFLKKKNPTSLLKSLEKNNRVSFAQIEHYLKKGGLPGICFLRDEAQRQISIENYLDALLGRDIQFVLNTRLKLSQLLQLLQILAQQQGLPFNLSHAARILSLSVPTVRRTMDALEALFLIRPHGKGWFLEDQGVATYLLKGQALDRRRELQCWVWSELRAQVLYRKEYGATLKEYSTRGGSQVPFVLEMAKGIKLAITVDEGQELTEKALKSLYSFQKKFPRAYLIHFHEGKDFRLHKSVLSMPATILA
ncbi:MAG: AAA family ATPase [bacterium]